MRARVVDDAASNVHGNLEKERGYYVIGVNPRFGLQRKRFTVCHEISHIFFEEASVAFYLRAKRLDRQTVTEEKLCDRGAAELLMPTETFVSFVKGRIPDLTLLKEISSVFDVSRTAAANRIVELATQPVAVVVWFKSESHAAVSLSPKQFSKTFPNLFTVAPPEVKACLSDKAPKSQEATWFGGGRERRLICESLPLISKTEGDYNPNVPVVLSLVRLADP